MFSQKAIFLDRDGTINVEKDYLYRIADFEFLPNVTNALRLLQDAGYLLIILTNQSGIARGYYNEDDFQKLNSWMIKQLSDYGVKISAVYYCPHHPNAKIEKYKIDCVCRKPKLGMFEEAITDFDIDLERSYTIGDKIRDCSICKTTNCRGFLISNNENIEIINSVKRGYYERVEYANDLFTAANKILGLSII